MDTAWVRVLALAGRTNEIDYQLRALFGLWLGCLHRGELRQTLALAQQFHAAAAAAADPLDRLVGDRMIGSSWHHLGDQISARRHMEHMLAHYPASPHWSHIIRFNFDQSVAARDLLARVVWLQGLPDQALHRARIAVEEAETSGHDVSLCHALAQAGCPLALWTGDLAAAERYVAMLIDRATRHGLSLWLAIGRCYQGMLVIRNSDHCAGTRLLRLAIDELGDARFAAHQPSFLCALAEGLAAAGHLRQALAVVDDAVIRCERIQGRWCLAELLRTKGELMLPERVTAAEHHIRQAICLSREQGALSFELRAAMSLARLRREQCRPLEAQRLLQPVYARFTEGFGTSDLTRARTMLEGMQTVRPKQPQAH
jgi:hypothetical protein